MRAGRLAQSAPGTKLNWLKTPQHDRTARTHLLCMACFGRMGNPRCIAGMLRHPWKILHGGAVTRWTFNTSDDLMRKLTRRLNTLGIQYRGGTCGSRWRLRDLGCPCRDGQRRCVAAYRVTTGPGEVTTEASTRVREWRLIAASSGEGQKGFIAAFCRRLRSNWKAG